MQHLADVKELRAQTQAAAIEVAGLSHIYEGREGQVPALEDISLTVGAGRFVVIVGPSGCGKTSLLMMMAGLRHQTSGTILCAGRPITDPDPDRVGVVFQEASLFPWLTALDNIEFPLSIRHAPREERGKRANAMLNLVGLQGFGGRYPHELSGGMKQRVSIARGLVQDPPVLLMDEPFAALDEQTRMTMGHELLRIWSQTAKTVVFVTHSLTEAVYLADEVLVMSARPGRIIDRIDITLPRPRTYEMMATDVFGKLRERIWQQIRNGAVRESMRRPAPATVRRLILVLILVLWELVPRTGLLAELFLPSLSKTLTVLVQNWDEYAPRAAGHALRGGARHADRLRRRHPGRRAGRRARRAAQPAAAGVLQPLRRADRHPLSDLHRLVRHRLGIQDRLRRDLRLLSRSCSRPRPASAPSTSNSCSPPAAWAPPCRSRSRA